MQIPFGTETSYNNRITTKYNKRGKEHIYNKQQLFIYLIKQDCMGMATNSQTSKCKVLYENGSIPLSITVCAHSSHLPLSLFCTQYDNVRPY